jgi:hypothetical protein
MCDYAIPLSFFCDFVLDTGVEDDLALGIFLNVQRLCTEIPVPLDFVAVKLVYEIVQQLYDMT